MEEECGREKLFTSWQPGSKEAKIYPIKDTSGGQLLPARPYLPQSYHLLIVFSKFESINGLSH
jgi:hypothetical protein